ncbi:MAG TPA: thioredoxin family protein [Verrucomicrobiae bacterium]|nr:thioredoxin family protein [Verrucomicrobiae bacterium]
MNLRFTAFAVLGLLGPMSVVADEQLPALRAGNNVYSNVTITAITTTDVYFTCAGGMGNAKLRDLDPDLQKHFHYDPAKAGEVEQKRATANAQYHLQVLRQPTPPPPADTDAAPPASAEPNSELAWGTDLPAALTRARSENKRVLLDFTGSDWCPWCIKFDHEVLSTDKFAAYARDKLVLVLLDFPRTKPQSETLKQANKALAKQFGVTGYPTYVLLNDAGKELGRQVGYAEGGPDAFLAKLESFR